MTHGLSDILHDIGAGIVDGLMYPFGEFELAIGGRAYPIKEYSQVVSPGRLHQRLYVLECLPAVHACTEFSAAA